MVNATEVKNKIIEVIRKRGPSLPIHISKEVNMSSLFTSAFLSELSDEKRIKVSNLQVGGSPLYYLEGQKEQLEKFYSYMAPKESEAYLLLKNKRVLKDSEIEPAIRVALRSIKDFAFDFVKNGEIYWKYFTVSENEINEIFNYRQPVAQIEMQQIEIKPVAEITRQIKPVEIVENIEPIIVVEEAKVKMHKEEAVVRTRKTKQKEEKQAEIEFNNPLVVKPVVKPKKEKPKSKFVLEVIGFINKHFKIIEEKEYKAKEYKAVIQAKSELGPMNFLAYSKEKKSVSDEDLKKLLSEAQAMPLPAVYIYTGELSKKAKEYEEKYFSILKTRKMER